MSNTVWRTNEKKNVYAAIETSHVGPLPAGMYRSYYNASAAEWMHYKMDRFSDKLLDLPGLPTRYIVSQIKRFWDSTDNFKKYNFLQKRGIMLYGPPGCGKTSIIGLLYAELMAQDGVCFVPYEGFSSLSKGIADFRKHEPTRPIMTVVEDIETLLESSNGSNNGLSEKEALALYDGEAQVNNVVHVATTNKPDVVADRFIRRPGRFDIVIGVHMPTRQAREVYLKEICNGQLSAEQSKAILDQTEGLSLAYMREIAATYLILGIPLEETISRLRQQAKQKYSTTKTGFTMGFQNECK